MKKERSENESADINYQHRIKKDNNNNNVRRTLRVFNKKDRQERRGQSKENNAGREEEKVKTTEERKYEHISIYQISHHYIHDVNEITKKRTRKRTNMPEALSPSCFFRAIERKGPRHIQVFSCSSLPCFVYDLFNMNPAHAHHTHSP